jgi:hypothetical protein
MLKWPSPSTMRSSAPGTIAAVCRAWTGSAMTSAAPCRTITGQVMSATSKLVQPPPSARRSSV